MTNIAELDTKASLIHVSRRLFSKSGYDQVSVRMICEEVGCNVSSISYHFGGKEALYRACLEANGLSVHALMIQILREPSDAEDFKAKLRLFLEKFYTHLCDNADVIGMLVHEIRGVRPIAADIIEKYYLEIPKKVERFLQDAKTKGIIRADLDTQMVSDLMLSKAFNSIFFEVQTRQSRGTCIHDTTERSRVVDQTMLIFNGGIYA